ncbi:unnamed protein product [Caenorhabditis brenneri]
MIDFQEIRTSTWAFLEAYGWITVFIVVLTYIIYKKYIYNVMKAKAEEKKLIEQRKFDRQVQEREKDRLRLARERQQEEHDEKERLEKIKRELKEKEEAERRKKEFEEQEKTCHVLGHNPSTSSNVTSISSIASSVRSPRQHAIEIVDNVPESASIIIFGYSTCPNFRKVCQLVSTYRLDTSQFQVFEFDKQPDWPVNEILEVLETRFNTNESPFVFISGEYIGGLEETRMYDREKGLDKLI